MATVILYNNDIQGALRALKKEMQKEGVFRLMKARKTFKNNREKAKERADEIVRRKIKDKHEKIANSAYIGVLAVKPKPFVFKLNKYVVKVYNDGRVAIYAEKNKKVNELMLDKANFDDIEALVKTRIEKDEKQNNNKTTAEDNE